MTSRTGNAKEGTMTDLHSHMGPISYLIVEFPGGKMTGEGFPILVELVRGGSFGYWTSPSWPSAPTAPWR